MKFMQFFVNVNIAVKSISIGLLLCCLPVGDFIALGISSNISSKTPSVSTLKGGKLIAQSMFYMEGFTTDISRASDVSPTDWAFNALQSFAERYGALRLYKDSTFRGQQKLTAYEMVDMLEKIKSVTLSRAGCDLPASRQVARPSFNNGQNAAVPTDEIVMYVRDYFMEQVAYHIYSPLPNEYRQYIAADIEGIARLIPSRGDAGITRFEAIAFLNASADYAMQHLFAACDKRSAESVDRQPSVTIVNNTNGNIVYSLDGTTFNLSPGESKKHSNGQFMVEFDSSFMDGYQSTRYTLRSGTTNRFNRNGNFVDLLFD